MYLRLATITTDRKSMGKYLVNDFCVDVFKVYEQFYPKAGFNIPWVGYFVLHEDDVIGVGGFKGSPQNGQIEIAYGVVPEKEGQGYATQICKELLKIAMTEDPGLKIIARTLSEEGASATILRKNGFRAAGTVEDPEDGAVVEWVLMANDELVAKMQRD